MTLEQAFAAVRAAGFVVNNLFQIDQATKWQCNLMSLDARHYSDYGIDTDPAAAVMAALAKMRADPKDSLDIPASLQRAAPVKASCFLHGDHVGDVCPVCRDGSAAPTVEELLS